MLKTNFKDTTKMRRLNKTLHNNNNNLLSSLNYIGQGNNLLALNSHNANLIDNAIKHDINYEYKFRDEIFKTISISNLVNYKLSKLDKDNLLFLFVLIDLEYSTNIRSKAKEEMINLRNYAIEPSNKFFERLKQGDFKLVDDMAKSTNGDIRKSFASKVCRYLSLNVFNNDFYYAYDTIVKDVLPYYLHYFNVGTLNEAKKWYNELTYEQFHKEMEEMKAKACPNLTRLQMDHILWYSYK